ncbi:IS982 family transposase [Companilactobacillus musae]|uniref:IS982 family transposase n=1 Tax=Companilactobacillus musae TaxID=1903258 RepID=UPI000E658078|nr:IS982 family transposase [Companilactobacillus musae]
MQDQPKNIAKPGLIQAKLTKFMNIIEPIYLTIDKKFRYRCNYREEKTSDLVILASMLLRIDLRDPSETHFHKIMTEAGIPLPERSRYNRRCRDLIPFERYIRICLLNQYKQQSSYEIIDSAPITLVYARRSNVAKVLRPFADKGYNAIKHIYFYGFKLHVVIDDQGFPLSWEVTSASTDDRKVAEELLLTAPNKLVLADGGYLSQALKNWLLEVYNINLWTPIHKNMINRNVVNSNALKNLRRRIETFFNNLNIIGHFEHPGIRTPSGLEVRLESMFLWMTINVHKQILTGNSGLKIT